jgi:hypothetical protein
MASAAACDAFAFSAASLASFNASSFAFLYTSPATSSSLFDAAASAAPFIAPSAAACLIASATAGGGGGGFFFDDDDAASSVPLNLVRDSEKFDYRDDVHLSEIVTGL